MHVCIVHVSMMRSFSVTYFYWEEQQQDEQGDSRSRIRPKICKDIPTAHSCTGNSPRVENLTSETKNINFKGHNTKNMSYKDIPTDFHK